MTFLVISTLIAAAVLPTMVLSMPRDLGNGTFLVEGDMLYYVPQGANKRYLQLGGGFHWPGGRIPYTIEPGFTSAQLTKVKQGLQWYTDNTNCIRWVPKTSGDQYWVSIRRVGPTQGCNSFVGNVKYPGGQPLNLPDWCLDQGAHVHEMGHAVGFIHEHSRKDRDQFLDIDYRYFQNDGNGGIYQEGLQYTSAWNLPFDVHSIMMYQENAICNGRVEPCMVAKNGEPLNCFHLGAAGAPGSACPTAMDKMKINKVYEAVCGTNGDGTTAKHASYALFEADNYQGERLQYESDVQFCTNLGPLGWDKRAASVYLFRGSCIKLYEGLGCTGTAVMVNGNLPSLAQYGFGQRASSVGAC